ncbi:hypothetical protein J8J20_26180, partial [Mycobacterium tuberculosis]|nr:hypothetical protein [Mycobacterium tuberculosis]
MLNGVRLQGSAKYPRFPLAGATNEAHRDHASISEGACEVVEFRRPAHAFPALIIEGPTVYEQRRKEFVN